MTKHHDHVLFGSANCTTAALSGAGGNAEACVYRRLTSGTAVDALGLDRWIDADRLELSNLAEREDVPEIVQGFRHRNGMRFRSAPAGVRDRKSTRLNSSH